MCAKWLFEPQQIKAFYRVGISSDIPDSKSVYSVLYMTDNRQDMKIYLYRERERVVAKEEQKRANKSRREYGKTN